MILRWSIEMMFGTATFPSVFRLSKTAIGNEVRSDNSQRISDSWALHEEARLRRIPSALSDLYLTFILRFQFLLYSLSFAIIFK